MSRRFLYFGLLGLSLGVALVVGPYALSYFAERQLRARLADAPVELSWEEIDWQWPTGLALNHIIVGPPDDASDALPEDSSAVAGFQIHGTIERLEVEISPASLLKKDKTLGDLSLKGAHFKLVQAPQKERSARESEDEEQRPSAENTDALLDKSWRYLERLGALRAENLSAELSTFKGASARLELHSAKLKASRGSRELKARGALHIAAEELTPFLKAVGEGADISELKLDWRARGSLDPTERLAQLKISPEDPEEPLISSEISPVGALTAGHLEAELERDGALSFSGYELGARLGAPAAALAELTLTRLSARTSLTRLADLARGQVEGLAALELERPRLLVESSSLQKTRAKLGELRAALRLLRALPDEGQAEEAEPANLAPRDPNPRARKLLSSWLNSGRASVQNGQLALRLKRDDGTARQIILIDKFDSRLERGRLTMRGVSATRAAQPGRVRLDARFLPDSITPAAGVLQVENLHLEHLPGVPQGRALPHRGVLGRVSGTIDARLNLWTEPAHAALMGARSQKSLAGNLSWRQGELDVAGLAAEPLSDINLGVDFTARFNESMALAELEEARLIYGPISAHFKASLSDYAIDPVLDFKMRLDEVACQDALRAIPSGLLSDYEDIEIEGQAAPSFSFYWPIARPRKLKIRLDDFVDQCQISALKIKKDAWPELEFAEPEAPAFAPSAPLPQGAPTLWERLAGVSTADPGVEWPRPETVAHETYELPQMPQDYQEFRHDDVFWLNRPFIKQVTEGVSEDAEVFVGPGTESYVPLDELPPFVGAAAYLSEEMGFYTNKGLALGLIERALRIDLERGRFVYGGSTVTQQLVKNLFLTREKLLSRKLIEALISWRIEEVVPKWRVLELYLNCIEYAPDIYGIGPAAEYYFGKDARELTPKEAVFIAILKPAPWYGDRFRRRGQSPSKHWWFDRMGEIMGRLVERGYLRAEQAEGELPYILFWDSAGEYLPDGPHPEEQPQE